MSGQQQLFTINGLVDTNKTVWDNLENLAAASAAFVTWDPYTEQYGVVINEPGSSIRSFNDDNIIGAINLTETPFDELYNSCEVRFPNRDVRDKLDTIRYDQPVADRFDNEPDNKLDIQYDFVNDPIQADVIALTELKQARVNKTISFSTDFTQMDLAAGDIIDITLPYWGWDQELFRIVEISQTDTPQGQIILDIVAIEYDAEVYNYNNLSRYSRTLDVGLPAVNNNTAVQTEKDQTTGSQFSRVLTQDDPSNPGQTVPSQFFIDTIQTALVSALTSTGFPIVSGAFAYYYPAAFENIYKTNTDFINGVTVSIPGKLLTFSCVLPQAIFYRDDSQGNQLSGSNETTLPVDVEFEYSTDNTNWTLIDNLQSSTGAPIFFEIQSPPTGYYRVVFSDYTGSQNTYQDWVVRTGDTTYPIVAAQFSYQGAPVAAYGNWVFLYNQVVP